MINASHEEVMEWNTSILWNTLNLMEEEESENGVVIKERYKSEIDMIKNGITMKVPIVYLANEWYELYPHSGNVTIKKYGKFELLKFMKEKEIRDKLMRTIIIENMDSGSLTESRN